MNLLPSYTIGFTNLWIFPFIYGTLSMIILCYIPKDKRKKILTFPKFNTNKKENILLFISILFGKGLIVYFYIYTSRF